MLQCTVCGDAYWPTGRWRDDICQECYTANFAASQELRVQEEAGPLTPQQRAAIELLQRVQARREDADAL